MREPATKREIPQKDRVLPGFKQYHLVKLQCYSVCTLVVLSKINLPIKLGEKPDPNLRVSVRW